MEEDNIIGIAIEKIGESVNFSQPVFPGDIVKVQPDDTGNVIAMRVGHCCDLSRELSNLPIGIQKKVIGLMRLAGANIKVDFTE